MVKLIRKATLEDVPQLVSLAIQMWKSHTVEDLTKIFCEHIRKGKNFIFLAISEEHIVGFAQCGLRFDYVEGTDSSPVGYLEGIFVLEEYKKRGYAKELLGECQNWHLPHMARKDSFFPSFLFRISYPIQTQLG